MKPHQLWTICIVQFKKLSILPPPDRGTFALDPPPLGICLPGVSCPNTTPPGISVIFQLGQAPLGNNISAVAPYCFPVFRQHNKYHKILMLFSWRDLFPLKFQLHFNCCKNLFVQVLNCMQYNQLDKLDWQSCNNRLCNRFYCRRRLPDDTNNSCAADYLTSGQIMLWGEGFNF